MDQSLSRVAFIEYLERLRDNDDRKALAILRRGLNGSQRTRLEMYPYAINFLREGATAWEEEVHLTVASLFATHPMPGGNGDMGSVLKEVSSRSDSESVEGRFMALLRAPGENALDHLKQCVSLARSKEVPIDWDRLYRDLLWWNSESMNVQRRWASSYWGRTIKNEGG
jgi:CRISPR system Cascade subunit CasB